MALTHPRTLARRYRLLEPVGDGSYGEIYRAVDARKNRVVCVKILRAEYARDPRVVARFEREARAVASIRHPNVVEVFDYGRDGDTLFIAMEWVDGTDLKQLIRERAPLPVPEAVSFVRQILSGLRVIHRAGIVHRDIKPHNVLVSRSGVAKLADFGIARGGRDGSLTGKGEAIGTAAYMAPEQARGDDTGPPADLYAAGVILFELLTGRLPFPGDNPVEVMYQHAHHPPPQPRSLNPAIPAGLESVMLQALRKRPEQRFHSAEEMDRALRAWDAEEPTRADRTVSLPHPAPTLRVPGLPRPASPLRVPRLLRRPRSSTLSSRFERFVVKTAGSVVLLLVALLSLLILIGPPGGVPSPSIGEPLAPVREAYDWVTQPVRGVIGAVGGAIGAAQRVRDRLAGFVEDLPRPGQSGPSGPAQTSCPGTEEMRQRTGVPVFAFDEPCGYHWDGDRIEGVCPPGFLCTFDVGDAIVVVQGEGQSYEIVGAGTWRYPPAYPEGEVVHDPCALLGFERDLAAGYAPGEPVEAANFACG